MMRAPTIHEVPVRHELIETIDCPAQALPETLGRVYRDLAVWAARHDVVVSSPFARYTRFDKDACTVEAGYVADRSVAADDGQAVRMQDSGGYTALSAVHVGPYSALGSAYAQIQEYMTIHGYVSAGAPVEYYLTPPETPPEQQMTEIVWPVRPNEM